MSQDTACFESLVTRAAHPGTPPEEARTAAVIVCKRIASGKVKIAGDNANEDALVKLTQELRERGRKAVAQRDERIKALEIELRKVRREADDARFNAEITTSALAAIAARERQQNTRQQGARR